MLSKAIGCWPCFSTAPIPPPQESHSTTKILEKSGNASMGQLLITYFIFWNAFSASSFHLKASFLVKLMSGEVILDNPFTNFL